MGNNVRGIRSKSATFSDSVRVLQPSVFLLQETLLKRKGYFSKLKNLAGYEVFELLRTNSGGGGLAIGVKEHFNPCLIMEGNDEIEMMTVEATINDKKIRFITGYGPQETDSDDKRHLFFSKLNEEICSAELAGRSIFIEFDANSKLGSKVIPGDPSKDSYYLRFLNNMKILHY